MTDGARSISIQFIPLELRELVSWLVWKYEQAEGKDRPTKVPYQALKPKVRASTTNPATWATCEEALATMLSDNFDGIGFVFTPADPFVGIDLDKCRDADTGRIQIWAEREIARFASYGEISPSGSGVHIIVEGKLPNDDGRKTKAGAVEATEIYNSGRYFAFTGDHLDGSPFTIEQRQPEIDAFIAQRFPPVPATPSAVQSAPSPSAAKLAERAAKYLREMPKSVSGQRGHDRCFAAAMKLIQGFGFSIDAARPILQGFSAECSPPWSDKEIDHKLRQAEKNADPNRRGELLRSGPVVAPSPAETAAARALANAPAPTNGHSPAQPADPPAEGKESGETAPLLNLSLPWADFRAKPRPPLKFHIEGILPEQGKMTISAVAKGFKTTLLIELGMCIANGNCDYLNFRFNDPASVLLVQPELSDNLLESRLEWIEKTAPQFIDMPRVRHNFNILETNLGRPALWPDHPRAMRSRLELTNAIERHNVKVVLADSLYMLFCGMEENSSKEMTIALDYLAGLTVSHGVSIILVHHFGKAATGSRGSSAYQGWGETDLAVSPIADNPECVKVDALLRCAFPTGFPAFWEKPTRESAWFNLTSEDWLPDSASKKTGRPGKITDTGIRDIIRVWPDGTINRTDLVGAIMRQFDCKIRAAQTHVKNLTERGYIIETGELCRWFDAHKEA